MTMAICTGRNFRAHSLSMLRKLARTLLLSSSLLVSTMPCAPNMVLAVNQPGSSPNAVQQANTPQEKQQFKGDGSGTLLAMMSTGKPAGQCPLKHTSVTARISGYVARVQV